VAIQEPRPNRTSITIFVVVLLCAASYAYSQGWFNWARPGGESMESNKPSTSQELEKQKTNGDTVPVTPQATEPSATFVK
jgi:hypothetical protein